MLFAFFIVFLIAERLVEVFIAKKNERRLLERGAKEYGQQHYPFIVALHVLFFISLVGEYLWGETTTVNYFFAVLFVVLLIARVWTISSLGMYWNTKILRLPGMHPIRKGPYEFLKHPNYIIVAAEIFVIPLVFHLYVTAIIFSLLNAAMLAIRIREENAVWTLE